MPGLDKTGPRRKGSKTGRGLGNCTSKTSDPENNNDHNNQILEKNFPRRMRMGKRGSQTWKQKWTQRRSGKII